MYIGIFFLPLSLTISNSPFNFPCLYFFKSLYLSLYPTLVLLFSPPTLFLYRSNIQHFYIILYPDFTCAVATKLCSNYFQFMSRSVITCVGKSEKNIIYLQYICNLFYVHTKLDVLYALIELN